MGTLPEKSRYKRNAQAGDSPVFRRKAACFHSDGARAARSCSSGRERHGHGYGVSRFAAFSDGTSFKPPNSFRRYEKKPAALRRRPAKRAKFSASRQKPKPRIRPSASRDRPMSATVFRARQSQQSAKNTQRLRLRTCKCRICIARHRVRWIAGEKCACQIRHEQVHTGSAPVRVQMATGMQTGVGGGDVARRHPSATYQAGHVAVADVRTNATVQCGQGSHARPAGLNAMPAITRH